jgi:serine/threonine protein kinase
VGSLRRWDPERIGPYAIVGRLGAGAMGQVYLARSSAGRLVAVKTIRVELAEEAGFRARFAREVAAARRVSGVFTAAVVAADAEADLPWVATAYVPAPSLNTLVRRCGPLPVPAVRWLAAGCAEALESIHGAGLLHRDVKPANVLAAPDGPRVIDFGVARAAERVQLTVTRGAAGTPAYMAPEQARDATRASPASDVFSLGATLVFAATGHAPYQGETVMDILVRLATEPPDLTGLPGELTDLIGACLSRLPRERPTTAAILASLGSFAAGPVGPGHGYLPDSAMELIAEYQQTAPRTGALAAGEGAVGEEPAGDDAASARSPGNDTAGSMVPVDTATSGSHTDLPGFGSAPDLDSLPGFGPPAPSRAADVPKPALPRLRRLLPSPRRSRSAGSRAPDAARWAAWGAAAVALVAAGIALGMALRGSNAQASGSGSGSVPPPPCASQPVGSGAALCVSQAFGDGRTVYVIHGSGYAPDALVTVSLAGVGASPDQPVTDQQGIFNYAIDQGHHFFPGAIPPGTYTAVVTATGERSVRVSFSVHPAGSGPPPGPPPPGP